MLKSYDIDKPLFFTVGHCNEEVVKAACLQMTKLSMAVGVEVPKLQEEFTRQLLETLPDNFEVVLYTNSGWVPTQFCGCLMSA